MNDSRKLLQDLYSIYRNRNKDTALIKLKGIAQQLIINEDINQNDYDSFIEFIQLNENEKVLSTLDKFNIFKAKAKPRDINTSSIDPCSRPASRTSSC